MIMHQSVLRLFMQAFVPLPIVYFIFSFVFSLSLCLFLCPVFFSLSFVFMMDKSASHTTTKTKLILDPANLAIDRAKIDLPMTALWSAKPRVFSAVLFLLQQLLLLHFVELAPPM